MNQAHKANQTRKRVKRIIRRLKESLGKDRIDKLNARLAQLA